MATHSTILAWRIPWTEEPGWLQSMGSQRVRRDQSTNTHTLGCDLKPLCTRQSTPRLEQRPGQLFILAVCRWRWQHSYSPRCAIRWRHGTFPTSLPFGTVIFQTFHSLFNQIFIELLLRPKLQDKEEEAHPCAQGTPSSASASLSVHSSEAGCSPRHFSVGGTSASNSGNASSSHSWAVSHAEKPQLGHDSWVVWAVWRETWSSHQGVPPARRLLLRSPDSPPSRHY